MVSRLFRSREPCPDDTVLDPGCGQGALIDGIIRWCEQRNRPLPRVIGIESDPRHVEVAREQFRQYPSVEIRQQDYLAGVTPDCDFIIGNPPYVAITGLSEDEKARFRKRYKTARGRFDLYLLFFERALGSLKLGGRLVFITPEKYLYVETAAPLRRLLSERHVEEILLVDEQTFGKLITYPTITIVLNAPSRNPTSVVRRDGRHVEVQLPRDGASWQPILNGNRTDHAGITLEDICSRVSCGVATGADSVFVRRSADLIGQLKAFTYPTIAGRELGPANPNLQSKDSILVPYTEHGRLLSEDKLGPLKSYLSQHQVRCRLMRRTCTRHKPWYAFHETPPLRQILRPKILCKDITAEPQFWTDRVGQLVPRHSVYYLVPRDPSQITELCAYLNSAGARSWLGSHCQHAANGFLRLQSRILKQLPVPPMFARAAGITPASRRGWRHTVAAGKARLDPRNYVFQFDR